MVVELGTCLHGDQSVVHEYFFCKEIGSDRSFVACAELLVDLCRKDWSI